MKVNGGYETIDVNENKTIGRYIIAKSSSDEKIRTIDGNIYINDMSEGEYILEGDQGTVSTFTINEDGTTNGNVRITYVDNNLSLGNNILASSEADIIVNVQTGKDVIRYTLIGTVILGIISLLMILKRKVKD